MVRKKRARMRAVGQWMVWLCTAMLIVLISISFWARPGARVMHSTSMYANRGVMLDLSGGRFRVLVSTGRVVHSYDPASVLGLDVEYWSRWPTAEKRSTARWLSPVWWVGGQAIRGPEVSLIYPCVLGVVWSVLIWRRRPRFGEGHCSACGYSLEGLVGAVCPECGETHEA